MHKSTRRMTFSVIFQISFHCTLIDVHVHKSHSLGGADHQLNLLKG